MLSRLNFDSGNAAKLRRRHDTPSVPLSANLAETSGDVAKLRLLRATGTSRPLQIIWALRSMQADRREIDAGCLMR